MPDVAVVCDEPQFEGLRQETLLNPAIIFEVLSPSTQSYDRGEKFLRYTNNIASLQDYLLISQDRPLIEHYSKTSNGAWVKAEIAGLDSVLSLPSISCEIALIELYDLIDFPAE